MTKGLNISSVISQHQQEAFHPAPPHPTTHPGHCHYHRTLDHCTPGQHDHVTMNHIICESRTENVDIIVKADPSFDVYEVVIVQEKLGRWNKKISC